MSTLHLQLCIPYVCSVSPGTCCYLHHQSLGVFTWGCHGSHAISGLVFAGPPCRWTTGVHWGSAKQTIHRKSAVIRDVPLASVFMVSLWQVYSRCFSDKCFMVSLWQVFHGVPLASVSWCPSGKCIHNASLKSKCVHSLQYSGLRLMCCFRIFKKVNCYNWKWLYVLIICTPGAYVRSDHMYTRCICTFWSYVHQVHMKMMYEHCLINSSQAHMSFMCTHCSQVRFHLNKCYSRFHRWTIYMVIATFSEYSYLLIALEGYKRTPPGHVVQANILLVCVYVCVCVCVCVCVRPALILHAS